MVRLTGKIILEKDCQLVIDLTDDEAQNYIFIEGTEVIIDGDFFKK